jgi:hypothetical protein
MEIIGILKFFYEKMDFSCFLVLKTGKLSNFALDKFFVPPTLVLDGQDQVQIIVSRAVHCSH